MISRNQKRASLLCWTLCDSSTLKKIDHSWTKSKEDCNASKGDTEGGAGGGGGG